MRNDIHSCDNLVNSMAESVACTQRPSRRAGICVLCRQVVLIQRCFATVVTLHCWLFSSGHLGQVVFVCVTVLNYGDTTTKTTCPK